MFCIVTWFDLFWLVSGNQFSSETGWGMSKMRQSQYQQTQGTLSQAHHSAVHSFGVEVSWGLDLMWLKFLCALFSMIIILQGGDWDECSDWSEPEWRSVTGLTVFLFFSYLLLGPSICFPTLCSCSPCPVGDSNQTHSWVKKSACLSLVSTFCQNYELLAKQVSWIQDNSLTEVYL